MVRPSVFTLGHAKIMEEPEFGEANKRDEDHGDGRRDNYKRGSSTQHRPSRYAKDGEASVGRRDIKKYGDEKNNDDYRRSDRNTEGSRDRRGRSSHRFSDRDTKRSGYEQKPDYYSRHKDSQNEYHKKSDTTKVTQSDKPAVNTDSQGKDNKQVEQKNYRGASRDRNRSTSKRRVMDRSTRNNDYYYAKKDTDHVEGDYKVKSVKDDVKSDAYSSRNTHYNRDDRKSEYRGAKKRDEKPTNYTRNYKDYERSRSNGRVADKDEFRKKQRGPQDREYKKPYSSTYKETYSRAEREERPEGGYPKRDAKRETEYKKPAYKDTAKDEKADSKFLMGQSKNKTENIKYSKGHGKNHKDFDDAEFPRLK